MTPLAVLSPCPSLPRALHLLLTHPSAQTLPSPRFSPAPCFALPEAVKCAGPRLPRVAVARFRPCIDIHKGQVKQIVGSTLKDPPPPSNPSPPSAASTSCAAPSTPSAAPSSPSAATPSAPCKSRPAPNPNQADQLQQNNVAATQSLGYDPVVNFASDKSAAEYARLYARDGLTGGHVIMLGADDASKQAALDALAAYPGGLQLGGGVNPTNAREYLDAGASHVIVTSYVFSGGTVDFERLETLVAAVGKRRLVLDLSCRKKEGRYMVVTDRWQKFSDLVVDGPALARLADYADEFLVHGVDVEGLKLGVDADLISLLGQHSPIPVTYAGGARSLEDLELVAETGASRVDVTVGSALDIFGGKLKYEDVVAWHRRQMPCAQ